jgi:hypothetical protein
VVTGTQPVSFVVVVVVAVVAVCGGILMLYGCMFSLILNFHISVVKYLGTCLF